MIAVTSLAATEAGESSHSTGTRLRDHADVVLDLRTPPADALVAIDGLETPVGPGSTIAAVALANEVKVRTAARLVERGAMPPGRSRARRWSGAEESRRLFDAAYAEHARRASRALEGAR